jgi:hypothetical protein
MRATTLVAAVLIPSAFGPPTACAPRGASPDAYSQKAPAASAQKASGEELLNTLSDEERAAGFHLLFDGESLAQWRGFQMEGVPDKWLVEDGTIHVAPGPEDADLVTRSQFDDFELKLEWKISEGGNSGIMFRVSEETRNTYESGPEMQVLDDGRHVEGRDPKTSAGANYGLHARSVAAARVPGEWNDVRIVVHDSHVEYWLNGTKVVEYELWTEEWETLVAETFARWPTYGRYPEGHIALQDHGDEVWYRNLRILPLSR